MKFVCPLMLFYLLVSCGKSTSVRDQTIIDAVKQKYVGKHNDYVIKVLTSEEIGNVAVSDSIRIISESFDDEIKKKLDYAQSVLVTVEQLAAVIDNNRFVSAEEKHKAAASLEKQRLRIDSLQSAELVIPDRYSTLPDDEVLVRIVKSQFSITEPSTGKELTDTYDFYLSPDLKTVYDMKKSK